MASVRQLLIVLAASLTTIFAQYGAMEVPGGLSPRFYLGSSPHILERQSGSCAVGSHSCLDVNATVCCPNTQYCITDTNFQPACCDIGSNCGNACGSTAYQCASTTTNNGQAIVTTACCPRSCPSTSAFKCASAYGGGCCSYGYACESGNQCTSTVAAATSAVVSEIPSGCTTSQIACPSSVGGGCCNSGLACAVIDNTNYCASGSGTAIRTGTDGTLATSTSNSTASSGLSTGAMAGIGAGVAGGACVILGGLLWFCIRHRRAARGSEGSSSVPALSQVSGPSRRRSLGRQRSDYFGPAAAAGPYTDDNTSVGTSPGFNRGVPAHPQSPGDIAVPVEIDSREHSNVTSPGVFEYSKYPSISETPIELP